MDSTLPGTLSNPGYTSVPARRYGGLPPAPPGCRIPR